MPFFSLSSVTYQDMLGGEGGWALPVGAFHPSGGHPPLGSKEPSVLPPPPPSLSCNSQSSDLYSLLI